MDDDKATTEITANHIVCWGYCNVPLGSIVWSTLCVEHVPRCNVPLRGIVRYALRWARNTPNKVDGEGKPTVCKDVRRTGIPEQDEFDAVNAVDGEGKLIVNMDVRDTEPSRMVETLSIVDKS